MNKTLTLLLPFCWLLAGCPETPPTASFITNCSSGPAVDVCPEPFDERNKVTIRVTPRKVHVTPPVVCATRGTTIVATIEVADGVPNKDEVTVSTIPKNAVNGWILSQGTGDGNTFDINVPESTTIDLYGYFAMASTGACEDPKIHVDN